jgi:hypothetical protein
VAAKCTVAAKRPELNGDLFLIIPAATVSVDVKRARSFCFRLYQKRGNETTFMDLQHRRKLRALRISGPGYGEKPLLDDRLIFGNSDALKHVYLSSIQFRRSTFFGPNLRSLYLGSCSFPSRNDLVTDLPMLAYLGFSSTIQCISSIL